MSTGPKPDQTCPKPDHKGDRGTAKALLPFIVISQQPFILEYTAQGLDRMVPCRIYDHTAEAVLKLMSMYWELESRVELIKKERDEAIVNAKLRDGELLSERERVGYLQRQIDKFKSENKSVEPKGKK